MDTHTPGPWRAAPQNEGHRKAYWVHAGSTQPDSFIAQVYGDGEADARLISAAPDLLASCKALIDLFDYYRQQGVFSESAAYNPHMSRKFQDAKEAIAKAEGQQVNA